MAQVDSMRTVFLLSLNFITKFIVSLGKWQVESRLHRYLHPTSSRRLWSLPFRYRSWQNLASQPLPFAWRHSLGSPRDYHVRQCRTITLTFESRYPTKSCVKAPLCSYWFSMIFQSVINGDIESQTTLPRSSVARKRDREKSVINDCKVFRFWKPCKAYIDDCTHDKKAKKSLRHLVKLLIGRRRECTAEGKEKWILINFPIRLCRSLIKKGRQRYLKDVIPQNITINLEREKNRLKDGCH